MLYVERVRASPACVGSLPNARPSLGGQGHRTPQAIWVKVPYPFRDKNSLGQSFRTAYLQAVEPYMNHFQPS